MASEGTLSEVSFAALVLILVLVEDGFRASHPVEDASLEES